MTPRFVMVDVEEHDALPEGCCLRFKIASEPRPVRRVKYETDDASSALEWFVDAPAEGVPQGEGEPLRALLQEGRPSRPLQEAGDGPHGESGVAWAAEVEDSGAGTSTLVYGGKRGLRLRPVDGGPSVAEPYLLLAREAVLG